MKNNQATATQTIQAGTLSLRFSYGGDRLLELLSFASRLNQKRSYLHVSRVLGKHLPVRPSRMQAIHEELADQVRLAGNRACVIGMAETATGLGAGVARALRERAEVSYQHTTRFDSQPAWVSISEDHSHASELRLTMPTCSVREHVSGITDLVLVDDEISTGRTLLCLVNRILDSSHLPFLRKVHFVSIVNWLSDAQERDLSASVNSVERVDHPCLMRGDFDFTPDSRFSPSIPTTIDAGLAPAPQSMEPSFAAGIHGYFPAEATFDLKKEPLDPRAAYVVIGMGEHLDYPFMYAKALERAGYDVLFQSTTRSPIAQGDCIEQSLSFSPRPGVTHYLHNPQIDRHPLVFDGRFNSATEPFLRSFYRLKESVAQNITEAA